MICGEVLARVGESWGIRFGDSLPNKSMQTGGRARFQGKRLICARRGRVGTAKRRERLVSSRPQLMDDSVKRHEYYVTTRLS